MIQIVIMSDTNYSKRELDAIFGRQDERLKEGFSDVIHSIETLRADHLTPILIQTKLTNGRVTKLEGWRQWITGGMAAFAIVLIPLFGWMVYQIVTFPQLIQSSVAQALVPYQTNK